MKISAVIPAHNMATWIERAIRSVLEQEEDLHELIVVDDGSTDTTASILSSFTDIRVISQPNRGVSAARNAGAAAASGDVIVFLDADDVFLPGALEAYKRALSENAQAGAAVGNHLWVHPDGTEGIGWPDLKHVEILKRADVRRLLRGNYLIADAAVRREVWQQSPFREDLVTCEDLAFWIDVLIRGVPVLMLPEVIVRCFVQRRGSFTSAIKLMREQRSLLYGQLARRPQLTRRERMRAWWMGTRAAVGERLPR